MHASRNKKCGTLSLLLAEERARKAAAYFSVDDFYVNTFTCAELLELAKEKRNAALIEDMFAYAQGFLWETKGVM